MTPEEIYQEHLDSKGFQQDPAQQVAVARLTELQKQLLQRNESEGGGMVNRLAMRMGRGSIQSVQGLYMWGGVGRGKTYLMDIFYDSLPFEKKMRIHFHRFMRLVHRELTELQGKKNPLKIIANKIFDRTHVICFDEFFVTDITDAMILGNLFEELFKKGITLVATSNIVPDRLYENGLQRDRFLPAIEHLKIHTEVMNVDGGTDYRLRVLEQAELYYTPLGEEAEKSLKDSFTRLEPDPDVHEESRTIEIESRDIPVRCVADDVVWFDFEALCDGPRSQNDYIEISRIYHAVIISNVPRMRAADDDKARRFINLVDEFYDRRVKLIVSAEVPITELYAEGKLEFEFERTQSRLLEMQSQEYLASEHLA